MVHCVASGGPLSGHCSKLSQSERQKFRSGLGRVFFRAILNVSLRIFQKNSRKQALIFLVLVFFIGASGVSAQLFDPPKTGTLRSTGVNLRSGPNLSDAVIGRIEGQGLKVQVLERRDNWLKVRAGGQEGWLYEALVTLDEKEAKEAVLPPAKEPPPVKEQVPAPRAAESPAPAVPEALEEKTPHVEKATPPAPEAAPEREDVAVLIREVTFSGNTVIDTKTLQKVAEDYVGRELTLEEMSELVDRITITYQEKGYILARAYLPKQDISDGLLQIGIMEGNVGKVVVTGKTHYDEKVVKKYFQAQLKDGVVKESALEKGLLLTNDLPDLKTNVVLKKGEEAGDVDVMVNAEDSSRMTLGVEIGFDYNNFGTDLTSKNRYGTTIQVVDHRWGTITNLRGVVGDSVEDSFLASGDFSVPLGSYGTRASAGYLYGNYLVGQNFADLGLDGYTKIWSLNVSTPAIKKRNQNLDFSVGYDNKFTKNYILEQERSVDEVDVFYASFSFDNLDRFLGKNILNAAISFGEVNRDGQIATSRIDEDHYYQRVNASYARVQKLFGYTNLFFRVAGQYSNDRLLPIEQFVLGGYGTVRGYDPALYLGDSGYTLTAELMFAPPFFAETTIKENRLAEILQFALFYDEGRILNNRAIQGELDRERLSGWGGGARIFFKDRFYFKYDVGFPLVRIPEKDRVFHYFQVGYQLF